VTNWKERTKLFSYFKSFFSRSPKSERAIALKWVDNTGQSAYVACLKSIDDIREPAYLALIEDKATVFVEFAKSNYRLKSSSCYGANELA